MKFCVTCKYHNDRQCSRPSAYDLVSGAILNTVLVDCETMRSAGGQCGIQAALYEMVDIKITQNGKSRKSK